MSELREKTLLTRLEGGFDKYLCYEGDQLRETVSAYVRKLARDLEQPDSGITAPVFMTGLRRRYLDAVKADAAAKQRYARVLDQARHPISNVYDHVPDPSILSTHLELLHRRKQHANLDVIHRHILELEKLSNDPLVLSLQPTVGKASSSVPCHDCGLSEKVQGTQARIRSLELAVVQARHEASREKERLKAAQSSISPDAMSAGTQLRALGAARRELTAWLERSLGECSSEELLDEADASGNHREMDPAHVQKAYDKYIEAREKLLNILQTPTASESTLPAHSYEDESPIFGGSSLHVEDPVVEVEQALMAQEQQKSLRQMKSYVDSLLEDESVRAVDMIRLLVDESHLLPAYPILARTGKFNNAKLGLDTKDVDEADESTQQVDAWVFAADAAGQTTHSTVTKQLKRGHEAVDGAQKSLKDLSFLRETSAET